jgi:hypothetical protein
LLSNQRAVDFYFMHRHCWDVNFKWGGKYVRWGVWVEVEQADFECRWIFGSGPKYKNQLPLARAARPPALVGIVITKLSLVCVPTADADRSSMHLFGSFHRVTCL